MALKKRNYCPLYILIIISILLGCEEDIKYDNRLQIYVNSTLAEEFIYSDDGLLKQEITYFSHAFTKWVHCSQTNKDIDEKYKYHYTSSGQLDYVDIYDLQDTYVGRDKYIYDDNDELIGIKY